MINFNFRNILAKTGIAILTALTIATSATGIVKVAKGFSAHTEATQVLSSQVSADTDSDNDAPGVEENSTADDDSSLALNTGVNTGAPFLAGTQTAKTSTQGTSTAGACIITVFGLQYDVTPLRSTHSGGDVFVCGGDNTAIYQSAHGSDVSRLQKYLVGAGGTGQSAGAATTGDDDDEDEDGEDEDEFEQEYEKARESQEHED
jgi:hypothetical protein